MSHKLTDDEEFEKAIADQERLWLRSLHREVVEMLKG